jgi:hypothetical protein
VFNLQSECVAAECVGSLSETEIGFEKAKLSFHFVLAMNTSFATGIYALMAEDFDAREKRDLTGHLQELLEALDCARVALNYESELALLCSLLYYCLSLRSCSGE